ncbi:WD repeat-containing protein 97-like [Hypanus sabinus]|uniref:WD repeat-containing protein 97-like n=1 Tax=Hypanus sabinus TaxID=79690 RepID=UPI0028C5057B|nr:WD repeat-containing protein 97-like [Hypanus sabinus]
MFNPKADELITGGVGGVKFWKYRVNPKSTNKILPMSNYELFLRADYPHMGGIWVKKVELDIGSQTVLCCSVQALFCYNTEGQLLVVIPHPHKSSLTACISSPHDESLLTASGDRDVNLWTRKGVFVHRFTGHTRAVTTLVLHPETSSIFISGSKDGTIRFWSLDTLTQLLSLPVLEEGVEWMGLTEGGLLYCCSGRHAHIYSLSYFTHFWSRLGSKVTHLDTASAHQKTTRLSVLLEEDSLHIMSPGRGLKLSQVLPLPTNTLSQYVYNRAKNLIFFLVGSAEIWIYSSKTNPACRVAVWNVLEILKTAQFLDVGGQLGRM